MNEFLNQLDEMKEEIGKTIDEFKKLDEFLGEISGTIIIDKEIDNIRKEISVIIAKFEIIKKGNKMKFYDLAELEKLGLFENKICKNRNPIRRVLRYFKGLLLKK